jgi:hypothetical protein
VARVPQKQPLVKAPIARIFGSLETPPLSHTADVRDRDPHVRFMLYEQNLQQLSAARICFWLAESEAG